MFLGIIRSWTLYLNIYFNIQKVLFHNEPCLFKPQLVCDNDNVCFERKILALRHVTALAKLYMSISTYVI